MDSAEKGADMLVLSRKKNESIVIADNVIITIVEVRGDKVRLGIEAPKDVPVHRKEVLEAILNEKMKFHPSSSEEMSGSN
jgi:carbon storage regulator